MLGTLSSFDIDLGIAQRPKAQNKEADIDGISFWSFTSFRLE
jgi:hypothetical protein